MMTKTGRNVRSAAQVEFLTGMARKCAAFRSKAEYRRQPKHRGRRDW